jgi:DNA (cytosine-5)-methyltransferase 1
VVSVRRQIGNAVPPYLGEALGYYLKEGVYGVEFSKEDKERIYTIRCGALKPEEYREKRDGIGGATHRVTLTEQFEL